MADVFSSILLRLTVFLLLSWGEGSQGSGASALQGFVGNEGLCTRNKTVNRLRPLRVWVTNHETYSARCGFLFLSTCTRTRVAGHWVTKSILQQEDVTEHYCCEGYLDDGGRCTPVCEGGCEGGECVAPAHCACLGGYIRPSSDPHAPCLPHCNTPCGEHQHCAKPDVCACVDGYSTSGEDGLCKPVCDPPCINANCSAVNICSCLEGYEKDSSISNQCNAVCSISCRNGFCSEPNVCSCNVGFEKDENDPNLCNPICPKKCKNGNCSPDNVCVCLENYKLSEVDPYKCEPICEKACSPHASCLAPDQCTCDQGYKSNENHLETCDPVCSKSCENGMCIAPEECTCLTYYEPSKLDPYKCEPICKDECVNGFCSSPQECTCNEGFRKSSKSSNGTICEPVCSQECEHGKCAGPNICSCFDGYETDLQNPFVCKPICSKACLNSNCSGPETCTCYAGYEPTPNDAHVCQPVCSQACVNANCSDPNVCTCHAGFVRDNSNVNVCNPSCSTPCQNGTCTAPDTCTCLEGFNHNPDDPFKCDPLCDNECINSVCSERNVCTCLKSYVPDELNKNKCNPTCSKKCQHGVCFAPEKCLCDEGYKEEEKDPFNCLPYCDKTCVNGKCTAPNRCECYENHEQDPTLSHICNAICRDGCTNGICVIPDTCICMDGYQFTGENSNICEPVCSACKKGKCEAPDVCKCNAGYRNPDGNNSTCEPVCSRQCDNGFCAAPDVCECSQGFKKDETESCRPYCSNGCLNGKCKSPEVCECLSGYLMDKRSKQCRPVCREDCGANGTCSAPDKCSCLWGFNNNYDKPTTCFTPEPDNLNCSFDMDFLIRNETEECYSTNNKLKLKNLSSCTFLNFLIQKHLSNETQLNTLLYEVKLNCSLDYPSLYSDNSTLAMFCLIEKVYSVDSEPENVHESLVNDNELGSDTDYRYTKFDDVVHRNRNAGKDSDVHPIGTTNVGGGELDDIEVEELEKQSHKEPIIYKAPLVPEIPLYVENGPPLIIKQQPPKGTLVNEQQKKDKSNSEQETPILPNIKKTLQNLAFEIWKKKKEPEADNLSEDFYQGKISKSPLGQENGDEVDGKVKIRHTQIQNVSKNNDAVTSNLKNVTSPPNISELSQSDNSHLNVEIETSDRNGQNTNDLQISNTENQENSLAEQSMVQQVPITIRVDMLPFIKREGITSEFFYGLTEPTVNEEWCLCFKDTLRLVCVGDSNLKVTLCRCSGEVEEIQLGTGQKLNLLISMTIAVIIIILFLCITYFAVRRWRRNRKGHELPRQVASGVNGNVPHNNSLHLHVNANSPAEDPDMTSSKL